MHVVGIPLQQAAIEEPRVPFGIPGAKTNATSAEEILKANIVDIVAWPAREFLAEAGGKLARNAFIRIQREDPIVACDFVAEVFLLGVAGPRPNEHAGACAFRDLHRAIRADRID